MVIRSSITLHAPAAEIAPTNAAILHAHPTIKDPQIDLKEVVIKASLTKTQLPAEAHYAIAAVV